MNFFADSKNYIFLKHLLYFKFSVNCIKSKIIKKFYLDLSAFIEFLARHDFVFSIFPSKHFVSVRHNLPYFDYPAYIQKVFKKLKKK